MSRPRSSFEQLVDESSSDDDDDFFFATAQIVHSYWHSVNAPRHGGSVMGHEVIDRNREARHLRLYQDYFSDNPTYGPVLFRRRFV